MSLPAEFEFVAWWEQQLVSVDHAGITESELDQILNDQGIVAVPKAYEGFLRVAGRNCGALWKGSDAFFPALIGVREDSVTLLEECGIDLRFGADDVVIGMHQGYEFLYLHGGQDDPPVLRFTEGTSGPVEMSERFSEMVMKAIRKSE